MRKTVVVATIVAVVAIGLLAGPAGARRAAGSGGSSDASVRIVNFNVLHGLFCAPETKACQASDRMDLLAQQLEESECPEVVGMQEVNITIGKELDRIRKTVCDGKYKIVFGGQPKSSDTERIFTTLKVKSKKVLKLFGGFRTASRIVLSSPIGTIVVVTTHQDGDPDEPSLTCRVCKPPCQTDRGVYDCQTDAAIALANSAGGANAIRVLMGDFNVDATSARYAYIIEDGFVDTHFEAGNAECVPETGVNCTSGRDDQSLAALQDPTTRESHRIDFIFVKSTPKCDVVVDTPDDGDGDGLGTGLFFPEPTVDGPGGLVWVSDHTGTTADLSCG
ncbi:MAG: endonuclease/exonuclease/phosphatase family protein [Acidimicrobiia bacterium]